MDIYFHLSETSRFKRISRSSALTSTDIAAATIGNHYSMYVGFVLLFAENAARYLSARSHSPESNIPR